MDRWFSKKPFWAHRAYFDAEKERHVSVRGRKKKLRCEKCRRGAGPLAGPRRPGDGPRARQTCASRRAPLSAPPPPRAPAPPPGSALHRPPGWGRLPVAAALAGASAGPGVQRPPWARSAGSQCCFDPIWCCFAIHLLARGVNLPGLCFYLTIMSLIYLLPCLPCYLPIYCIYLTTHKLD